MDATTALARRAAPTPEFIADLRARYQVEPEIDAVLTRKLHRRTGPGYHGLPLERLVDGANALITRETNSAVALTNPRWLPGGSSKLQMGFDLRWSPDPDAPPQTQPMVLRMEPPESIVQTSRRREFEILRLMQGHVPVPHAHWVDPDAACLPYPALIYSHVDGVARPSARPCPVPCGIGTAFAPDLREPLAEQFVAHLAAIHTVPAEHFTRLTHFSLPVIGSSAGILRQIDWWRRVWDEDRPEDVPLFDVAAQWLIANVPTIDHVSVVHGDYRIGNILFDEDARRITAVLDWELAVLGDRHQDLAWVTGPSRERYAEDGRTVLACGLLPAEDFLARYERASGCTVDLDRLRYFQIFNGLASMAHMLASAWRVVHHGKTHQDVVVTWASMVGPVIAARLRRLVEGALR